MLSNEEDRKNVTQSCLWKKLEIADIFQYVYVSALGLIDCHSKSNFLAQLCAPITGGQRKLIYFVYFPWLPVEGALSILNITVW
jgi:hypothetical protein